MICQIIYAKSERDPTSGCGEQDMVMSFLGEGGHIYYT
jgi:hypothetical protein